MPIRARYVHTNLVARDWRALAAFYEQVFGCTPVPPERALSAPWLDRATGLPGAQIQGIHLRLPGHGEDGPTLEVFQYSDLAPAAQATPNRPGYGHLAFSVDDVRATCEQIVDSGGGLIGEVVQAEIPGAGTIEFAYATDPEGNIIEVQRWLP